MNLALLFTIKFYAESNNKASTMPIIVMIYPRVFNKMAADLPTPEITFWFCGPGRSNCFRWNLTLICFYLSPINTVRQAIIQCMEFITDACRLRIRLRELMLGIMLEVGFPFNLQLEHQEICCLCETVIPDKISYRLIIMSV